MTYFEQLCAKLNVKQGSKYEIVVSNMVNDLIFDENHSYTDEEIENIDSGKKNYQTSVYYMDIVSELEKMGDFMINVSQTLEKTFIKRN